MTKLTPRKLKRDIERYGFTVSEFADVIGVAPRSMWRYCEGTRRIPRWLNVMIHLLEGGKLDRAILQANAEQVR
jgi:transcriptional regulator with XRE-family HTH domain